MNAPPTYRTRVRHLEQERIREREAAGKCIACGREPAVPPSLLCAGHRSELDRQQAAQHANARDRGAPLPPPFTTPRIDAPPSSRRRGEP